MLHMISSYFEMFEQEPTLLHWLGNSRKVLQITACSTLFFLLSNYCRLYSSFKILIQPLFSYLKVCIIGHDTLCSEGGNVTFVFLVFVVVLLVRMQRIWFYCIFYKWQIVDIIHWTCMQNWQIDTLFGFTIGEVVGAFQRWYWLLVNLLPTSSARTSAFISFPNN